MRSIDFLEKLIILLDSLPLNASQIILPTGPLPIETIDKKALDNLLKTEKIFEVTVKRGCFFCQIDSEQNLIRLYRAS